MLLPAQAYINNINTVNILMPAPFADSSDLLVKQFNQKNKGRIKLKVTRGPRETESVSDLAISSLLLGKTPFDLILMDVTWMPKYAAAGWLSPLDEWITDEDIDSLVEGAALGNKYEGKLYRWPFVADIGLLYWRTDLMKEPPKTPDELIKITTDLMNEGSIKYGYVWQGRQYEGLSCVFLEVINGFGGEWLNGKDVGLNSLQSKKAAKWLLTLIKTGISPPAVTNFSEPEALQVFKDGEAALMRNWPYAWAELNTPTSKVKGNVGLTTMVSEKDHPPTSTLGSWGFSLVRKSKHNDKAIEAIKFLTSTASQKMLFKDYGYTPTRKEVFNDDKLINSYPVLKSLEEGLKVTMPRPQTPFYTQISDVLQRELSSILTEQKSVSDSLDDATKYTKQILLSAGGDR